jgi:hypothetical protein
VAELAETGPADNETEVAFTMNRDAVRDMADTYLAAMGTT